MVQDPVSSIQNRKCLLGIMSQKIPAHTTGGDKDICEKARAI